MGNQYGDHSYQHVPETSARKELRCLLGGDQRKISLSKQGEKGRNKKVLIFKVNYSRLLAGPKIPTFLKTPEKKEQTYLQF